MKTKKKDSEAECRRMLAPLADKLARTDAEERRRLVETLLPQSNPTILRLLAELLVRRLEYRSPKVRDGAEEALVLLGTRALPALECAVLKKPTEALLLKLAPLLAAQGVRLPEHERRQLQMTLMIAANRAPTHDSSAALWAAVGCLRDPPLEPGEPLWPLALARAPVQGGASGSQELGASAGGRVEVSGPCGIMAAGSPEEAVPCQPPKPRRRRRSPSP